MCLGQSLLDWCHCYGIQWPNSGKQQEKFSTGEIVVVSNSFVVVFQSAVTDLLEPFGLKENRMYINFFDMPRANVGWSRKTFAG